MAIRFTHGYDLIFKFGAMFGGIMVVAAGAELLHPISDPLEGALKRHNLEWVWVILTLAYGIGGYFGAIMLLEKTVLPHWLPTYLHVRFSLFTRVTHDEAERLGFLFDGSMDGTWYPLGSIRKIDPEFRREALFRFANKIAEEHGWRRPFAMPEDYISQQRQQFRERATASEKTNRNTRSHPSHDAQISVCLEILGLSQMPLSFEAVKSAYRRKIKEFHPDKFAGERTEIIQYAEETSKRLNAAYAYLERHFAEANA